MKTWIRPVTAVILALLLGNASVVLASARGHGPAVGAMEICAGLGLQTILVDADGNPVGPPHICPDGATSFVTVDVPVPEQPLHLLGNGERLSVFAAILTAQAARPRAMARGPPRAA